MNDRKGFFIFCALLLASIVGIGVSLEKVAHVGADFDMGDIQKIFYFHVSCAWLALASSALAGFCGAFFLWTKSSVTKRFLICFLELSVLFGLCVLVTGPLWGKKAWGAFWVWDARLTSTLLLFIIACTALFAFKHAGHLGPSLCASLSVFALINVPLVYFSVDVAKTLHPPKISLSPPMKLTLLISMASFSLLFCVLFWLRSKLYSLQEQLIARKMEFFHEE